MIATRFDLVKNAANKDMDLCGFVRVQLHQVPDVGETVSLNGNPFVVVNRAWAVSDEGPRDGPCLTAVGGVKYANRYQHAYVQVVKKGEFNVD